MKIYKYFKFEHALQFLLTRELVFSCVSTYNDPFEGAKIVSECFGRSKHGDNEPSLFDNNHIPGGKSLVQAKIQEFDDAIACCFSRTFSDLLLWSHYAEAHQGIVICFDSDELFTLVLDENFLEKVENIAYCNEIAVISGELNQVISTKVKDAYLRKAKCWSYEEEVRCLLKKNVEAFHNLDGFGDKFLVPTPKNAILSIYCGVACSHHIAFIINAFAIQHKISASVISMARSETEYKITPGKQYEKYAFSGHDISHRMKSLESKNEDRGRLQHLNKFIRAAGLVDIV